MTVIHILIGMFNSNPMIPQYLNEVYMLGAICGSAQSMDYAAQSVDPYIAQESMDCAGIISIHLPICRFCAPACCNASPYPRSIPPTILSHEVVIFVSSSIFCVQRLSI